MVALLIGLLAAPRDGGAMHTLLSSTGSAALLHVEARHMHLLPDVKQPLLDGWMKQAK